LITYENHCVSCATESYPCIGNSCPNRHVKVLTCDCCGEEVDKLYRSDYLGDVDYCADCALKEFEEVE
jgi:hypothetical protein